MYLFEFRECYSWFIGNFVDKINYAQQNTSIWGAWLSTHHNIQGLDDALINKGHLHQRRGAVIAEIERLVQH